MNERTGTGRFAAWLGIGAGASNWLWLSAFVAGLDQIVKLRVVDTMIYNERIAAAPLLDIVRLHNTGAAFSFLAWASGWQRWFFIAVGLVVSVLVVVWLRRLPARGHRWLVIGLALILGGALGNVVDRVLHGYVVDFLHFYYPAASGCVPLFGHDAVLGRCYWPAFNVADIAISIGAGCLIVDAFLPAAPARQA